MEDEPLSVIRETTKNVLKVNRQVQKDKLSDVRRSIETTRIAPDTVASIANRLKHKTAVSLSELHTLKNTIIENKKNIDVVLGTNGALRGLVRELTGQDVKRQCAAAGCLCNLALGDSKACAAIAKAAGPYLILALDNLSTELATTCAWALGSAAAGAGSAGRGACAGGAVARLCAGGAVTRLVSLLAVEGERRSAALYALVHFARQMEDEFSKEHIEKIIEANSNFELDMTSSQLLFIVSCHEEFLNHTNLVPKLLHSTAVSLEKHINTCSGLDMCCNLTYLLRTLSNLSVNKVNSDYVINYINDKHLLVHFKRILSAGNTTVKESLLWLLGNLFNFCSDSSFVIELPS